MPAKVDVDETLSGGEAWFPSDSPAGDVGVVFEDDGQTGYLYACRLKPDGDLDGIIDALQVYNVESVTDRDKPSRLQIAWTPNGSAAALIINKHAHAVFDFANRKAACRTGFPPPVGDGFFTREPWSQALLAQFR